MTHIIDGKKIALEILAELKPHIEQLKEIGITPKLVNIAYNPDSRSEMYIEMKRQQAEKIGIEYEYIDLSDTTQADCIQRMTLLANNNSVHGIIVQLPINDYDDPQSLLNIIPPSKDVDGLSDQSLLDLQHNQAKLQPATPLAIIELLKRSAVDLQGKKVAVIGQGKLVGKPLGYMLQNLNVDTLLADASTVDLAKITQQADIIISATGQPGLITADLVPQGSIIIDAGIAEVEGVAKGDVDFNDVKNKVNLISPVPGGVGPVTVAMLLSNVVTSAQKNIPDQ
ncbi:bifunctional 5,10-methylenetetrahydrofolate dehydrogenase/5,10-methenyltetrahydrofolate cyclohydrolase [Candidatus Saccharibacteria bacterium]|nr:bifunctional 5,10-methylenetetrahydrofolate dehydrogenase/5,10-methenyltetrahydrofolate cyclohydrolase [Candidatus Saccharibacteria bacterium]